MYVSLDGFGNSRHPRTYLSLPCIYTHTVIYSYENPCVVLRLSTFTNDPEKPCYSPEMVTLLAGESGPDARAEKASAALARNTPANPQTRPPPLFP